MPKIYYVLTIIGRLCVILNVSKARTRRNLFGFLLGDFCFLDL